VVKKGEKTVVSRTATLVIGGLTGVSWGKELMVKVNQSHYRPEVPRVFQEVKVARLRDSDPEWW